MWVQQKMLMFNRQYNSFLRLERFLFSVLSQFLIVLCDLFMHLFLLVCETLS